MDCIALESIDRRRRVYAILGPFGDADELAKLRHRVLSRMKEWLRDLW